MDGFSSSPSSRPGKARKYPLSWLKDREQGDMVKSKPQRLWINGVSYKVSSWTESTMIFTRTLLDQNLIHREDLPFIANSGSDKAYIHYASEQPNKRDSLFKEVGRGFYVDTKYNASYHVKNMWWTLEKLGLQNKWNIEMEIMWN